MTNRTKTPTVPRELVEELADKIDDLWRDWEDRAQKEFELTGEPEVAMTFDTCADELNTIGLWLHAELRKEDGEKA